MYIDEKRFGKQVKAAYDSAGVTIRRTQETLVLVTAAWAAEFTLDSLPKEMHAAIVKVTGWLPDVDEAYEYRKGEARQSVMPEVVDLPADRTQGTEEVMRTPVKLEIPHNGDWAIMQSTTGKVLGVPSNMIEVINRKKLEPGEVLPKAMLSSGDIIWRNEYATMIMPTWRPEPATTDSAVIEALEMMGYQITPEAWSSVTRWERVR